MIRVLVIQELLPHYRVPLFDRLASKKDLDLTVCHSGRPTAGEGVAYREHIVRSRALGPFRYQCGILRSGERFDVIVASFDVRWLSTLAVLMLNRNSGFVFWGLGMGRHFLANRLRLLALKRANALLLYGAESKVAFEHAGYPGHRIFVAPNTIHVANASRNKQSPRNRFVFVGTLKPRKRVADLLLAFKKLATDLPPEIGVKIVGSGEERGLLEKLSRELGLQNRVDFGGHVTSSEELKEIFDQAIAYVSPGQVGLGVLHSFAYGVPVVTRQEAPHGPEVHNIVNGVNGYLYDGTIEALADRLYMLATDRETTAQLGAMAFEHYSRKRTLDHMIQGFREVIQFVARERTDTT